MYKEELERFRHVRLPERVAAIALVGHSVVRNSKGKWFPSGLAQKVVWRGFYPDGGKKFEKLAKNARLDDPDSILGGGTLLIRAALLIYTLRDHINGVMICSGSPGYLRNTGINEADIYERSLLNVGCLSDLLLVVRRDGKNTEDDILAVYHSASRFGLKDVVLPAILPRCPRIKLVSSTIVQGNLNEYGQITVHVIPAEFIPGQRVPQSYWSSEAYFNTLDIEEGGYNAVLRNNYLGRGRP